MVLHPILAASAAATIGLVAFLALLQCSEAATGAAVATATAAAAAAAAATATATEGGGGGAPFLRCAGGWENVPGQFWEHVKDMQALDSSGRRDGRALDPRSDALDSLREILKDEVLTDLKGAISDCVFGLISLLVLTLPLVDTHEGFDVARERLRLADGLLVRFIELLPQSDWALQPGRHVQYRQLLGFQQHDCEGSGLKIYIYNTTSDLTRRRLATGSGMMGAASHFHAYFENGACQTTNAEAADLFLIPANHGAQYDEFLEHRAHFKNASEVMLPYLNRNRGADHFFVVSANLPSWPNLEPLRNAMQLTVESYQVNDGIARWYSPWKDIMIPGYIDRWRIAAMRSHNKPTMERGYTIIFHGNHPGTHALYVKHSAVVRTNILDAFTGIHDCSVGGHVLDFFPRMGQSHFCLVPRGSSAWTIHLYESFFFGCIPVILSDQFDLPFQEIVDWPSFSIKWPMDKIDMSLLEYLRAIPKDQVARMKDNLERNACWFDYHNGWTPPIASSRYYDPSRSNKGGSWTLRATDAVVLEMEECPYLQHGDGNDFSTCQRSCEELRGPKNDGCNIVNFRPGECILRRCVDVRQPPLTTLEDFEVWSLQRDSDGSKDREPCSPFAAVLQSLEHRSRNIPKTHGLYWMAK